jgi:hypothetical protein
MSAKTIEKALILSKKGDKITPSNFVELYFKYLPEKTDEDIYKRLVKDLNDFSTGKLKTIDKLKFVNSKKENAIKALRLRKEELEKKLGIDASHPAWKVFEDKKKKEIAEKSSVKNSNVPLKTKEKGFTFDGKINQMVKGIFKNSSFSDYLLHSKEVNFLKTDMKIKTKPRDLGNGVVKNRSLIEVKNYSPRSRLKIGEIASIRTKKQWLDYLAATKKVAEKLTNKKYTDEQVLKIATTNYSKMIDSVLNDTPQKKNAIMNRMVTQLTPKNANSFLLAGKGKEEKIVPFTKEYIDFSMEGGGQWAPYKDAGFSLPRVVIYGKMKPGKKYDKPVVENLEDFTKEILNG